MKKISKRHLLIQAALSVIMALAVLTLISCENGEGPMQTAGEKIDNAGAATGHAVEGAVETTGHAVKTGAEKTGGALKTAGEKTGDAVENTVK
jgi:hypothetical protein